MEDNVKIKVKNRSHSPVVYVVPDMGNLRREFSGLEEKIVTFEELRKLNGTYGGSVLLKDYLVIRDEQAVKDLNFDVEPEYFYNKEDVERILTKGSMDEFLDCLDFAPQGVIDLIKEYAVTLPLNDVAKREVLLDKFDYDVNKIIEVRRASTEEEEEEKKTAQGRRAAVPSKDEKDQKKDPGNGGRRVVIKQEQ